MWSRYEVRALRNLAIGLLQIVLGSGVRHSMAWLFYVVAGVCFLTAGAWWWRGRQEEK